MTEETAKPCQQCATLDVEAIAWAYRKLMAFGVHDGKLDSALMMDCLNALLGNRKRCDNYQSELNSHRCVRCGGTMASHDS